MLCTSICKYEDFNSDWYIHWMDTLGWEPADQDLYRLDRTLHRKRWEFAAIIQALHERGMLERGKRGCGFAVGQEPLSSLFAARGVEVCATDLPTEASHGDTLSASAWASTGQHVESLKAIHVPGLIDAKDFEKLVRFKPVDMRNLCLPWNEQFDFLWSSCSLEHLGTLDAGMKFVQEAMQLLVPGGIAVHTTEFNVGSNDDTVFEGPNVVYRKQDIERLDYRLRQMRCGLSRCDFFAGDHEADLEFDNDPFGTPGQQKHVKLLLVGQVVTSILLIIRKGHP